MEAYPELIELISLRDVLLNYPCRSDLKGHPAVAFVEHVGGIVIPPCTKRNGLEKAVPFLWYVHVEEEITIN